MDVFIIFMVKLPDQTFRSMRDRTRSVMLTAVSPQPKTSTGCPWNVDQEKSAKPWARQEKYMIGKIWILASAYSLDG